MVDLTPAPDPKNPDKMVVRARLLDLVVGRSGPAYAGWLAQRGEAFQAPVQVATLDPFRAPEARNRARTLAETVGAPDLLRGLEEALRHGSPEQPCRSATVRGAGHPRRYPWIGRFGH